MPQPWPTPPATPQQADIGFADADFSTFDANGIIRFRFTKGGATLTGDYLTVQVRKSCEDANFWWWPTKDCRPNVEVVIKHKNSYVERGHTYNSWYIFGCQVTEPKRQPKDKHCKDYDLTITIDVRSVLPELEAEFKSWLGQGHLKSDPLASWLIPLQVCCKDCVLTSTFDVERETG